MHPPPLIKCHIGCIMLLASGQKLPHNYCQTKRQSQRQSPSPAATGRMSYERWQGNKFAKTATSRWAAAYNLAIFLHLSHLGDGLIYVLITQMREKFIAQSQLNQNIVPYRSLSLFGFQSVSIQVVIQSIFHTPAPLLFISIFSYFFLVFF